MEYCTVPDVSELPPWERGSDIPCWDGYYFDEAGELVEVYGDSDCE